MRSIYTEACVVLVLESELLMSTVNCANEERLMRITCSSWLRRLWTYQEGVLAQKLFFQFNERAVSMEELWDPILNGSVYDRFSNGIALQGSRFYETLLRVKDYNAPSRFLSLLDALQWRQTSKTRDECICIAALFGLDIDQILNVPDECKFRKLLEMQRIFIKGILFLSGPKMTEEGYGWAPSAMMKRRGTEVLQMVINSALQEVHAQWTYDGLLGEWYGLELMSTATSVLPETFLLSCLTNSKQYIISRATEANAKDKTEWTKVGPQAYKNAAIVLEDSPKGLGGKHNCLAVLVELRRKNLGIWYAKYKCRMVVKEYEEEDAASYKWGLDRPSCLAVLRDDGVERMHHGYPWCIM
ncbi:hypothetical protein V8C34DRAFT_314039 [Trichoderma compactum]